jgi:hypothetical protein
MQIKGRTTGVLWVLLVLFTLSGCASYRYATTLKPDPGNKGLKVADGVKFALVNVRTTADQKTPPNLNLGEFKITELNARASEVYPALFGIDFADLPVSVSLDCTYSSTNLVPFGLGIIPLPGTDTVECAVRTRVADVDGYAVDAVRAFTLSSALWGTLFTPLGLIPVPGAADVRSNFFTDDKENDKRIDQLMMDSLVEAVARSVAQADKTSLQAAAKSRRDRLGEQTVHGARYWTYLGFSRSDPKSEGPFDVAILTVFGEKPSLSARPLSQATVAGLKDRKWQPAPAYLQGITPLISVKVVMGADGKPAGARLEEVAEPPLEDFVNLPDKCQPDHIRWSNAVLVEAKNTSLRKLVQQGSPEVLTRLVTRIEKAVLDLNERAQLADSRAQQLMVDGKDAKEETETAVLCRQRTAIFQAILPALKQAAAKG